MAERSGTAEPYVAEWLKGVRDALDRIERVHPDLGRHLRDTISTGTPCAYAPAAPVDWEL